MLIESMLFHIELIDQMEGVKRESEITVKQQQQ